MLLIVGPFVLPVIGPVAGLICAWLSPAWRVREKAIATVLASGSILLMVVLVLGPMLGIL